MSSGHRYLAYGVVDIFLAALVFYRLVLPVLTGAASWNVLSIIAIVICLALVGMGVWFFRRAKANWGES